MNTLQRIIRAFQAGRISQPDQRVASSAIDGNRTEKPLTPTRVCDTLATMTLVLKAQDRAEALTFARIHGFTVLHVLDLASPEQFAVRVLRDNAEAAMWYCNTVPHRQTNKYAYGALLWYA